eukprot:2075499-Amphidinium_carterae.1
MSIPTAVIVASNVIWSVFRTQKANAKDKTVLQNDSESLQSTMVLIVLSNISASNSFARCKKFKDA